MARKRQPIEQTYSPEEVADFCRVHRRTVYRWLSDGTLLASKAGPRTWVITQTQLNAFLAPGGAGKKQPKQQPEKQPATEPEEKQQPEEKPLEKSEGGAVEKPNQAAVPEQPELPAEMLPKQGPEKFAAMDVRSQLYDRSFDIISNEAQRSGLLQQLERIRQDRGQLDLPEPEPKPEVPETWRGKKRRK